MRTFKSLLYNFFLLCQYTVGRVKDYKYGGCEKSILKRFIDQVYWIFKEGKVNTNYYLQGIGKKGNKISSYIGTKEFIRLQRKANKLLREKMGYCESIDFLTKNKLVFSAYAKTLGIPVPDAPFAVSFGKLISLSAYDNLLELEDGPYFIKNTIIESGEGVHRFMVRDRKIEMHSKEWTQEEFISNFNVGVWIIQKGVYSHKLIQKVNDSALNTTRIYTMNTGYGVELIGAFQAFATDNATIDSWQFGTVYVGINTDSLSLTKYGVTSLTDTREGLLQNHPNSGVVFSNYSIPYIKETVHLCKYAHELLLGFFIIGWDVAITEKGPIIIEANEKPGINVVQCFTGGLKKVVMDGFGSVKKSAV
jgi:hypothetical protein